MNNVERNASSCLNVNEAALTSLAKDIWEHPQLGLHESYASKLIMAQLEKAGFSIEWGVAQMPTAFVASWGQGKPIIGILGEYDALPGLSQKISAQKDPIEEGGPGHGCGHNLLGVASLGAVIAAKEAMEKDGIPGTLRYYGCPAEETLVGKVFMARDGVFDDLDAAITWHPMYANTTWSCSCTAMNSFKFSFHGISAHAAAAPEAARSALDGVMLTDVGINYLREHVIQEARIHCVVTNGGLAPNVVPAEAQVWYYVRAPRRPQVEEIYQRVLDVAKGAALMTGTTFDVDFIVGCHDYLPNEAITQVMMEKLRLAGAPEYTDDEIAFANQLKASLAPELVEGALRSFGLTRAEVGDPLCDKILDKVDALAKGKVMAGSTDVGDVSYVTPTGQVTTCCMPLGVPVHSWQSTASTGSSIGFKGMMLAAKTMAFSTLELMARPDILKAARGEFEKATGGRKYTSPLPEGAAPEVDPPSSKG